MTEYIKIDSDRPDFEQTLHDPGGEPVNLQDATGVQVFMWDELDNLLINDAGTIADAFGGEIRYDFTRDQIVAAGENRIEVRVDWADGNRQWFPIVEPAYMLQVVGSAGDRTATLSNTDPGDALVTLLEVESVTGYEKPYVDVDTELVGVNHSDIRGEL